MKTLSHPVPAAGQEGPTRGGYEIVDKFARKEIFIEGALADYASHFDEGRTVGRDEAQIARALGITERTVKAHLGRVFREIGVLDRTSAALWARDNLPGA